MICPESYIYEIFVTRWHYYWAQNDLLKGNLRGGNKARERKKKFWKYYLHRESSHTSVTPIFLLLPTCSPFVPGRIWKLMLAWVASAMWQKAKSPDTSPNKANKQNSSCLRDGRWILYTHFFKSQGRKSELPKKKSRYLTHFSWKSLIMDFFTCWTPLTFCKHIVKDDKNYWICIYCLCFVLSYFGSDDCLNLKAYRYAKYTMIQSWTITWMPTGFSWDTFVHAKSCHCRDVDELFSGRKKWRKSKGHLPRCFNLGGTG